MDVFEFIKSKVPMSLAVPAFTDGVSMEECGTDTLKTHDDTCPFEDCGHRECFRVKENEEGSFFKCFSCDAGGDVIEFVMHLEGLDNAMDAARLIAQKCNLTLPDHPGIPTAQKLFTLAAEYYHARFLDTGPSKTLGMMTPMQYQIDVRGHHEELLRGLSVGWSDGELCSYLVSCGFSVDDLREAGLMSQKSEKDFLPANCFIYPHYVKGRVSHFTFKDPLGKLAYQLPKKCSLNGYLFYGQDTVEGKDEVIVVEGENDLISVLEGGWHGGLLATIGQISGDQLKWIIEVLEGKHIVTIFDRDDAGEKYRDKLWKLENVGKIRRLTQLRTPEPFKDVDEFVKKGGHTVADLFKEEHIVLNPDISKASVLGALGAEGDVPAAQPGEGSSEGDPDPENKGLHVHNGCYAKIILDKDAKPRRQFLSNFTIELRNIFEKGEERVREVVFVRQDGYRSRPTRVTSDMKVSLKTFKVKVSDAIDGIFYGSEHDLQSMWQFIYAKATERIVKIPDCVGYVDEASGWLFGNCFVDHFGVVQRPDKEHVFWLSGNTYGIRPQSPNVSDAVVSSLTEVPMFPVDMPEDQRKDLTAYVLHQLAANLNRPGLALTMMGWAMSCAYAERIFHAKGFFPFLYLWGQHGCGKTSLMNWILACYDMKLPGMHTVPNLRGGIGFERKLAYYSNLPIALDEMRADKEGMKWYGSLRGWYNRVGRSMGSFDDDKSIVVRKVRACFLLGGEDIARDNALQERSIQLHLPVTDREMKVSYDNIVAVERDMPGIGLQWIKDSYEIETSEILSGIGKLEMEYRNQGCSSRSAQLWSICAYFALKLRDEYMPEFDYNAFVVEQLRELNVSFKEESNLAMTFLQIVEVLMTRERTEIGAENIKALPDRKLAIWLKNVHSYVEQQRIEGIREWTLTAISKSLKEQPYFISNSEQVRLGATNSQHRCFILDASDDAPETLRNIYDYAHKCC